MSNGKTLPALANEWGVSLDALRALVRRKPELRALGVLYGPTRVYSPDAVATIRKAWDAREAARAV